MKKTATTNESIKDIRKKMLETEQAEEKAAKAEILKDMDDLFKDINEMIYEIIDDRSKKEKGQLFNIIKKKAYNDYKKNNFELFKQRFVDFFYGLKSKKDFKKKFMLKTDLT